MTYINPSIYNSTTFVTLSLFARAYPNMDLFSVARPPFLGGSDAFMGET